MPTTRAAALAAATGGLLWLALVPAVALYRDGDLSYGGYQRLVAVPLLAFVVAWALLRPQIPDGRALLGWWLSLAGFALAFAGSTIEFWAALPLGRETAATSATRGAGWWGADVGWTLFALGFLVLASGGPTAAVGLRRQAGWPMWACTFVAVLGVGVMLANVLHDARPAPALVGLGAFATGWLALAIWLWRRPTTST
jgi:hypothetical protein